MASVPGAIGQLQDDLVLQVVDLPQPAVIGYVVPVHEGLQTRAQGCEGRQAPAPSVPPGGEEGSRQLVARLVV